MLCQQSRRTGDHLLVRMDGIKYRNDRRAGHDVAVGHCYCLSSTHSQHLHRLPEVTSSAIFCTMSRIMVSPDHHHVSVGARMLVVHLGVHTEVDAGHPVWTDLDTGRAFTSTSAITAKSTTRAREGEEQAGSPREEDDGGYQEERQGRQYGQSARTSC